MKKILLVLLGVIVIGGGWYWFTHRTGGIADEGRETTPTAHVEVAPLQRQPIVRTLDAFGGIGAAPSSDAAISAPFDCLVRTVEVGPGARVAAGDLLLEIEPSPDAKLALASARTALAAAEESLATTRQRYDLKLATSQELLGAKQAADDARLKLASLDARGLGGNGRITAPTNGVVSKLDLAPGTLVPAGTLLVSVVAADRLEARLAVEIEQLAQVKPGAVVQLFSANRPDLAPVSATVRAAGGSIDAASGTAEVRVGLPSGAPFYFGERVRGAIVVEQREGFVVPRNAVRPDGDQPVLFTVRDGKAVRHEVRTGIVTQDRIEVRGADLNVGDSVVTLGNYELTDGMAVVAAPASSPAVQAGSSPEAKP